MMSIALLKNSMYVCCLYLLLPKDLSNIINDLIFAFLQVNLQMKPYKHISFMKNLPRVDLFPILWADEGADLDEDNANKLKDALQKPINIVNGSTIAAMVLGGILIIIGLVVPCTIKGSQYNL